MSFTVEEEKFLAPVIKPVNATLSLHLQVPQHSFSSYAQQLSQLLSQYFTLQSLQLFRVNQLQKLLRIQLLSPSPNNYQKAVHSILQEYRGSSRIGKRERLYHLLKTVRGCEVEMKEIMGCLAPGQRAEVMGLLLGFSLFENTCDIFNSELQECFSASESSEVKASIFKHYNSYNTKLEAVIVNLGHLEIKTQEFKLFIIEIVAQILNEKKESVMGSLKALLNQVGNRDFNVSSVDSGILFLFSSMQPLTPLYYLTLKEYFPSLLTPEQFLMFNHNYISLLSFHKHHQLANHYDLSLKQYFNRSHNLTKLYQVALRSQTRHQFTKQFLSYLTDFREAEDLLIGYYFRSSNYHQETQRVFLDTVETVIGRNYIGSICQLIKEFKPLHTISLKGETLIRVRSCNISLYPRHWKVQKLADIVKNKGMMQVIGSLGVLKEGVEKLRRWEDEENKKEQTRTRDIVHHEITVVIDNKAQIILSLQQLMVVILTLQGKSIDIFNPHPSKSQAIQQCISRAINQPKNPLNIDLGSMEYPLIDVSENKSEEVEPPASYVVEGKLLKVMKKHRRLVFEEIRKHVMMQEQLLRVVLNNLVKKGFVEIENQVYVYLP